MRWIVFLVFGVFLIPFVSAVPFCGDGVVEKTAEWDEASGKYPCWIDLAETGVRPWPNCKDGDTEYAPGSKCTWKGEQGMCTNAGHCLPGLERFVGRPSEIVVMNKTVKLEQDVLIYVFDPGRSSSTWGFQTDAFLVRITDNGSKEYLSNFCNAQTICNFINPEGKGSLGHINGRWKGYAKLQRPGGLVFVKDFSGFAQEPPEEDKRYWMQTRVDVPSRWPRFAFKQPGKYALEIITKRGKRVTSEPFTVCDPDVNCDPTKILGIIEDGHNLPVEELKVELLSGKENFTTYTNEKGEYEFNEILDEPEVTLKFTFSGKDGQFRIIDDSNRSNAYLPVTVTLKEMHVDHLPKVFDFVANLDLIERHTAHSDAALDDIARTHLLTSKAATFADEELGVQIGKGTRTALLAHGTPGDEKIKEVELPKEYTVRVFSDRPTSSYNGFTHTTRLNERDSLFDDFDRPDNGDWHEISHGIMFVSSLGGLNSLPKPYHGGTEFNHLGYANPSTTDSFVEGFAIFMSAVIQEKTGFIMHPGDKAITYRIGHGASVHLDDNVKVWADLGRDEELAVATLLWDLHDGKNDDKISLGIDKLWPILSREGIRDMKDVYDALITAGVGKEAVDEIFVLHGFYHDDNANKKHDDGEEIGRAANGGAFLTSFDLSGSPQNFWDVDLPLGSFVSPDKWKPTRAPSTAGDDVPRWGSADTDGDDDLPTLVLSPEGEFYESGMVDTDGDGDFGVLTDLDGDGKGELTEDPFWVLPFDTRRGVPVSPRKILELDWIDKDGNSFEGDLMFEVNYKDSPEKDYQYTVPFDPTKDLSIYVPDGAVLSITGVAGEAESKRLDITHEQFVENLQPRGNQGQHTLEAAKKGKLPWLLLVVVVSIGAGIMFLLKFKKQK